MKTISTLIFGALIVFAWGPWVNSTYIWQKLESASLKEVANDNTGESCRFHDVVSSSRTVFGFLAVAEYACPVISDTPNKLDNEETFKKRTMLVTSFGEVFVISKMRKIDELGTSGD